MNLPRIRMIPASRQRKLALLVGAVAIPALALAALAVLLTFRVAREVEAEASRYNAYLAEKVTEAFEVELITQLRDAIVPAESIARDGGSEAAILRALATRSRRFEAPHYVPVDRMDNLSMLMVESQVLLFGEDPAGLREHPFAAVVLRGPRGDVTGAGGWWFNPRAFIATSLDSVVRDRLNTIPRMYGGLESTRNLCVQIFDREGHVVARFRDPGSTNTTRRADMTGPFEGFRVSVTATSRAPVATAQQFVMVEVVFIFVLTAVMLGAVFVALRYILRQIELVQEKTSFVSNVTHELKTPIAVVKLAAETLEMKRFRGPEEEAKYLHTIMREADRLTQLVDNILDFSRLESGKKMLRMGPVAVSDLVAHTLESFRLRLEDAGFALEVDVPADLPKIRADAIALQHCLLNLLDNAVKYSRERKQIRLFAHVQEGFVSLSVADRGIGIEPEHQGRIFEKFVRVETGLVHTVKGAGLGLSLVDQIIRAHYGRVEVASTPGEGSIFTLLVPIWVERGDSTRPTT